MIPKDFHEAATSGFIPYMIEADRASKINHIIKDFKSLVRQGYNPNDYIDDVLSKYGFDEDDLTDKEVKKINDSINNSSW